MALPNGIFRLEVVISKVWYEFLKLNSFQLGPVPDIGNHGPEYSRALSDLFMHIHVLKDWHKFLPPVLQLEAVLVLVTPDFITPQYGSLLDGSSLALALFSCMDYCLNLFEFLASGKYIPCSTIVDIGQLYQHLGRKYSPEHNYRYIIFSLSCKTLLPWCQFVLWCNPGDYTIGKRF